MKQTKLSDAQKYALNIASQRDAMKPDEYKSKINLYCRSNTWIWLSNHKLITSNIITRRGGYWDVTITDKGLAALKSGVFEADDKPATKPLASRTRKWITSFDLVRYAHTRDEAETQAMALIEIARQFGFSLNIGETNFIDADDRASTVR